MLFVRRCWLLVDCWLVVRCVSSFFCGLLLVGFCALYAVGCLVVCCSLLVDRCLLVVICCLFFVVVCNSVFVWVLFVHLLFVV